MRSRNHSFFILSLFLACLAFVSQAQPPAASSDEAEVKILRGVITQNFRCSRAGEMAYTAEGLQKLLESDKECREPAELKVDFAKESLIGYEINGDCQVRAIASLRRSDKTKTYTVAVKIISGGCRAVGNYFGWLVVDKLAPDYKVSYTAARAERYDKKLAAEELSFLRSLNSPYFQTLETREIEMKDCIQLIRSRKMAILNNEEFLRAVRNDASRGRCLKELEKIDFGKYSLLGININSGYCGVPAGLEYQAYRDDLKEQYLLSISYIEPNGTCRHLSQYDVWTLVPKMPDAYEAVFETNARPREK
jgi:hypothetical protein